MFRLFNAFGFYLAGTYETREAAESAAADELEDKAPGTRLYVAKDGGERVTRVRREKLGASVLALD